MNLVGDRYARFIRLGHIRPLPAHKKNRGENQRYFKSISSKVKEDIRKNFNV